MQLHGILPHVPLPSLADENVPVSHTSLERERAVHEAVDRLTPAKRRAVKAMYGFSGVGYHSASQAACAFGCTCDAVRANVYKGRKVLQFDSLLCKAVGMEVTQ